MRAPSKCVIFLIALIACEGPEGSQGEVGPIGPAGPQGQTGAMGPRGEPGADGVNFFLADFTEESQIFRWTKKGSGSDRIQNGELVVRGGKDGLLRSVVSGTQFSGNVDVSVATRWLNGDPTDVGFVVEDILDGHTGKWFGSTSPSLLTIRSKEIL